MCSAEAAEPLRGRLAVVAGATGGIGRAIAQRLASGGVRLVLVARRRDRLDAVASATGGRAVSADIATEEGVDRVADVVRDEGGSLDLLVNAAGSFAIAPVAETSIATFDSQISSNLRAPFLLIRTFLPEMIRRGSGHILTIGSVAGRQPFAHNGAYAAAKYGIRGLHEVLTIELRGTGVRATLIEAAATDTALWEEVDTERTPGLPAREAMLAAAEVAEAVIFAATRPTEVALPNVSIQRS